MNLLCVKSATLSTIIASDAPGTQNEFLLNPYGALYDQMTASCMIRIDIDGNILFNPSEDYEVNRSGYIIHGAIHKARHDVDCIIHTRTLTGMTVASMQCGLLEWPALLHKLDQIDPSYRQ